MLAGMLASGVLDLFERFEQHALGHEPLYSARHIALRLARARGPRAARGLSKQLGAALRFTYGTALGTLLSGRFADRGVLAAGMLVGGTIYGFELVVAPAVRAVPPLRAWPKRELLALFAHTGVFGIAAVGTFRALASGAPRHA
jgi:hypothetical protein